MVVRIQLSIKHIRGHSFTIETDVDSEVLGLKVQIWESQKIPVENQRLVFSGKELADTVILSQMGIGDNATIFLVESSAEVPQTPQFETPQVTIETPQYPAVTPQYPAVTMVDANGNICQQQCSGAPCTVPVNLNYYGGMEVDSGLSEERMQSVIDLAFWARLYCLFGLFWSVLYLFFTWYGLIPVSMYLCGYIGTRTINRCLLVFPMLLIFFFGYITMVAMIYSSFAYGFYGYYIVYYLSALFHIMLFSCFCRLMCRISKINCQEWFQIRIRIRQKRRCL